MGASQRIKGVQFERKVASQLRRIFPEAKRHLEYQDGEAYGMDIANTGEYAFQCKKHKKYVSINTIKEIKCDLIPVLVTAADREEVMAVLPFDELLRLLEWKERSKTEIS